MRETPLFPKKGGTFLLNTEEVATLFHPPIELVTTSTYLPQVKTKKSGAPSNLPVN